MFISSTTLPDIVCALLHICCPFTAETVVDPANFRHLALVVDHCPVPGVRDGSLLVLEPASEIWVS
jgi:hypothetical protein